MKIVAMAAAMMTAGMGTAFAADLAPIEPIPTWTGCYAGVHVGGGTGDKISDAPFSDYTSDIDGPLGGGQVGCDYQFERVLIGLVGDIAGTGIDGDASSDLGGGVIATSTTEIDWLATIRGRLGMTFDNALLYATGGVAIAGVNVNLSTNFFPEGQDQDNTHVGWTVGAGLEYKVTEHISVFGEYLFADLGDEDYTYGPPLAPQTHNVNIDELHTFKIGANYRF